MGVRKEADGGVVNDARLFKRSMASNTNKRAPASCDRDLDRTLNKSAQHSS